MASPVGAAVTFPVTSTLSVETDVAYRRGEGRIHALSSSTSLLYSLPRVGQSTPDVAAGFGLSQYGAPFFSSNGRPIGTLRTDARWFKLLGQGSTSFAWLKASPSVSANGRSCCARTRRALFRKRALYDKMRSVVCAKDPSSDSWHFDGCATRRPLVCRTAGDFAHKRYRRTKTWLLKSRRSSRKSRAIGACSVVASTQVVEHCNEFASAWHYSISLRRRAELPT